MQLGGEDGWQESDRAEVAGTPARLGGRRPARAALVAVERGSPVAARGRACPTAWTAGAAGNSGEMARR
jgi:hypothetical protein